MVPAVRKLALTAHITFSVGWLGAVAEFLALALAGLTSHDPQRVRASYLMLDVLGWWVIVPASGGALLTGLVQALGTRWGLFRHYWVLVKLLLTVGATSLLLLHMQLVSSLAATAASTTLLPDQLRGLRVQLTADAAAGMGVLLVATVLSVYKPWGPIRFSAPATATPAASPPHLVGARPWGQYVLLGMLGLALLAALVHLAGGGLHHR